MQDMSLRAPPNMSMKKIEKKGVLVLCSDNDQTCIANRKIYCPEQILRQASPSRALRELLAPQSTGFLSMGCCQIAIRSGG